MSKLPAFLEIKDVRKHYGAIKAVDGVSLTVGPGEIVGVIGPNGSGKTTLFNSILGQIRPTSGSVEFCGEDITGMSPLDLSRRGVGRTFQTLQVFVKLSVRDNLIAAAQEFKGTMLGRLFASPDAGLGHHADEMIELFRLKHVAHLPAGSLSYGQQKLIDIAMAFMPAPRLVLLDEPCAGVNPGLVDQLHDLLLGPQQDPRRQLRRHRAQHGFHHEVVPARRVHGRRQGAGRRAACRSAIEPASARRLPGQLTSAMAEKIIEFDKVVAGYSPSLTILNQTTLDARKGEITLLIGPNGAGKSTVLKTLFGMLVPRSGEVRFEGECINGKPPRQLLADGIAFVPQGRNLFGSLSVRHNLELGGITLQRGELAGRIEEVLQRFPRIRERIDNQASTMSGGEQKQLEIGRALLLHPRVLLIDEPSIGLSPKLVQDVMTLLRGLADAGTTVLMVEQNVRTALKYSNRALVLEMGRLALDRPAAEVLRDPDLNRLFLGGHAKPAAVA